MSAVSCVLLGIPLLIVIVWRVVLPTMNMERKTSAAEKQTVTKGSGSSESPSIYQKGRKWVLGDGWKFILGLLLLGLLWYFWGSIAKATPDFSKTSVSSYAVPFAIVVAALLALTYIIGEKASGFRKGIWVAVVGFIAISLFGMHQDWKSSDGFFTSANRSCDQQPATNTEVRDCVLTDKAVIMTAKLTGQGDFEFCVVKPEKASYHAERVGPNAFKARSTEGTFLLQYKMINRNDLTGGRCPDKF